MVRLIHIIVRQSWRTPILIKNIWLQLMRTVDYTFNQLIIIVITMFVDGTPIRYNRAMLRRLPIIGVAIIGDRNPRIACLVNRELKRRKIRQKERTLQNYRATRITIVPVHTAGVLAALRLLIRRRSILNHLKQEQLVASLLIGSIMKQRMVNVIRTSCKLILKVIRMLIRSRELEIRKDVRKRLPVLTILSAPFSIVLALLAFVPTLEFNLTLPRTWAMATTRLDVIARIRTNVPYVTPKIIQNK